LIMAQRRRCIGHGHDTILWLPFAKARWPLVDGLRRSAAAAFIGGGQPADLRARESMAGPEGCWEVLPSAVEIVPGC
jgi:hypothetical protein